MARKGLNVMLSLAIAKVANFAVILVVVNLLSQTEYGRLAYGLTILSFIMPFVGGGIFQGLLRYGALSKGQIEKKILFKDTFWKGIKYSFWIIGGVMLLSPLLSMKMPEANIYLIIFSFQVLALFVYQMIQVYCRLIYRNKLFASIDIQNSLLLLVFNILMCYFLGGIGYAISIVCVPFFLSVYYLKKLNLLSFSIPREKLEAIRRSFDFNSRELLTYGLYMSIGSVVAQLLFAVDIILIGNVLENPEDLIAQYKVSSIIPYSLLMLAGAVLATDFVKLANTSAKDKKALQNYYANYLKVFSVIGIGIVVFFYFFTEPLIRIFGSEYQGHPQLMFIFAVGVVGALMFRIPMGNMLSAIGWPKVNAVLSTIILVLNVFINYFMISWYGIEGAALTTAGLMWLSGLLSLGAFIFYLRK